MADSNRSPKINSAYEQSIIDSWTGLSAFPFGVLGLVLPKVEGNNKEAIKMFLKRNVPLAIVGAILGGIMGASTGRRKVKEHRLLMQEIANSQKALIKEYSSTNILN